MNVAFPPPLTLALVLGLAAVVAGVLALAAPRLTGRLGAVGRLLSALRIPLVVVGGVLLISTLLTPTPETNLANPVPATVTSIARGQELYLANCARCHGVDARGGGPDAGSTPAQPPALAGPDSHLSPHTDGDLHYWIAQGLPGGMPAWAETLSDEDIWRLVNFLRSLR